ncbi:hypothetical protein V501_07581 [Pseudogymnoascus sp. VKM F-4519 (FW-2642)]|nr:hypothetical protein V499_03129 [Pseudogymnoascus sp. VKM F-103]KFZ06301.1 hypothetical protein V501_07581 [Pseudogymnoascus sp. VKM F-4519 (FW-2642)]
MSASIKGKEDTVVEMVENSLSNSPSNLDQKAEEHEFMEAENQMTLWQAAVAHKRILLYCIVPYLCGMTYGYDVIANGATLAMPSFLIYFGAFDSAGNLFIPSIWTSLWVAMTNLGQAVGSFAGGPLAHRFGRRYVIMAFSIVSIVGVSLQFTATTRGILLGGKIINGFAVGGLLAVGTTYASEVAPLRLRAPVQQGLVFCAVVMQGCGLGVIRAFVTRLDPAAFRIVFGLQWVVGSLPLLAFFIPESPTWLLSRGRTDDARASLNRLYKKNNVELRLDALQATLTAETAGEKEGSFIECFKGTNLKRTATVSLLFFGSGGLIGASFLSQNIYFLLTVGLEAVHSFDIGIGGFFLACVAIAIGWFFTDVIGRRTLWLVGVSGNAVAMAVIGALSFDSSRAGLWAIAVLMNVLISFQIYTCVSTSWTMAPELSSYRLRQHTQSFGYIIQALSSWFFQFIVPYMYNIDSGNLGAKTGFVFAGTSVLLFCISWFVVPETSGLSVEDIDAAYIDRVSPRKFHLRRQAAIGV